MCGQPSRYSGLFAALPESGAPPIIRTMPQQSTVRRALVFLCLLFMQGQLWALGTLPCLHEAQAVPVAGCPYHGGMAEPASDLPDGGSVDCAKCALTLLLGSASPPVADAAGTPVQRPVAPRPVVADLWFSLPPEPFYRPPIA